MTDSKHWLDEASDADEFERAVLRAGLNADPPRGKESEVWSNLLGAVAVVPVAATIAPATPALSVKTAVGSASKAVAVWLGVGKGFVLGLAVYGAAAGVSEISERLGARPKALVPTSSGAPAKVNVAERSTASARTLELAPELPAVEPAAVLAPAPSASLSAPRKVPASGDAPALPSTAAFPEPQRAARASQLQAETAALRSARAALRAGNLAEAFATLAASQRQFAAPELDQEREALLIELLFRSGRTDAARQRARAFLVRFPESPHADPIRQLLGPR